MINNQIIVIGGPTASGKTQAAITLARKFQTVILSADSRQCYKELNIGVARPHENELSLVKHYFIADRSICQPLDAFSFALEARNLLQVLFQSFETVVVVGGTGLYLQALIEGLDIQSSKNEPLRNQLENIFAEKGIHALQEELKKFPSHWDMLKEKSNKQRIIRAIEIASAEKENHDAPKLVLPPMNATVHKYFMHPQRDQLYDQIGKRLSTMVNEGWEEEAKLLWKNPCMKDLPTVGYYEWFAYFEGKMNKAETLDKIAQHTRNYAKRQVTWFKNKGNYQPIDPSTSVLNIFESITKHGN